MRTGSGRLERIMLTPLTIGFLMKYLVFLFCLFAAASAFSQEVINYDQASLHLDSYVTVCGKVAQVVNKGDHSFINFGATYPNQKFVLYITKNKYGNLSYFSGKNVCATGTVINYNGKPEIVNPTEIKVIRD